MAALTLSTIEVRNLRGLLLNDVEKEPWMAQVIDFLSQLVALLEAPEADKAAVKEIWAQIHQALSTLRSVNAWIPTHELSLALQKTNLAIESIPLSFCMSLRICSGGASG